MQERTHERCRYWVEWWIKCQDGVIYKEVTNIVFLKAMFKYPLEIN